jgi:hypothetical protein
LAGEEPFEMLGEIGGVGCGPIDQRRLPPAEELQADHIGAGRRRDDAAVVDDLALAVGDRQVEP